MAMQIVDIELAVRTATNDASYRTRFTPKLNVIEAPNSWGKSTLVQSMLFGLGLEGAISTSHLSPLGEAMTSVIDLDGQREAVLESSVTMTLLNDQGKYLRTRRFARSLQYEINLVQTWSAESLDDLSEVPRVDYFVRQAGGAAREAGFHHELEEFLGWNLPDVPGFNGDEIKLYLEIIFPLFYVEQKYGWAGLAPRVPTHYRVRSAYRRAAEWVLGLSSLERTKELERVRIAMSRAQEGWRIDSERLALDLAARGWRLQERLLEDQEPDLQIRIDDEWVSLAEQLNVWRDNLALMSATPIMQAGERTSTARRELVEAESSLARQSARLRAETELHLVVSSEFGSLRSHRDDLESEKVQLRDILTLERLGSELHSDSISHGTCPVCSQSLDQQQVATGIVMNVESNLALIDGERAALTNLIADAESRVELSQSLIESLRAEVLALRDRVRGLKDELAGPSYSASVGQIAERLELARLLSSSETAVGEIHSSISAISARAQAIATLRTELSRLQRRDADAGDQQIILKFKTAFQRELERFGFRSLPVDEVTIGAETLLPEHDGFELTFDIHHGLSASDSIRAKWAYYVGLTEASRASDTSHQIGFLILDEPRQQEAELSSVRALYTSLEAVAQTTQVIVASSAGASDLAELLEGLDVNRITATSAHMLTNSRT